MVHTLRVVCSVVVALMIAGLLAVGSRLPEDLGALIRPGTLAAFAGLCQTVVGFILAIRIDRLDDRTDRGSLLWLAWTAAAAPWVGPVVGFWLSPLLFIFLFSPVLVWGWLVGSLIKRQQWQVAQIGGVALLASWLGTAGWLRGLSDL